MALTDESNGSGFYMPVAPAYGGGYGSNGGFFGGDWAWILLLLLIGGNGWGFGGFGGGFGGAMMGADMGFGLYPWLNNSEHISDGFRDQMIQTSISSLGDKITSGFGDVATQLCGGFAGVNAGIANAAAQSEISANARQMASMNQLFGVQSALQQCCCDNKAGLADVKYTIATEACADRAAVTQGIQTVLDKLCALELDGYKREADNLRQQLNMAQLTASQTAQTAQILAGQSAEIDGVYNRLKNCPVPSMPVYGNTPIFTCGGNTGCGCGCGSM